MTENPGETHEASTSAVARVPYVIDTSVAIKWYIPEAHSVEAKAYIGKGLDRHCARLPAGRGRQRRAQASPHAGP